MQIEIFFFIPLKQFYSAGRICRRRDSFLWNSL